MSLNWDFLLANVVHLGYILQLSALMVRDVLLLRVLLMIAQLVVAFYTANRGVYAVACWNLVLVCVNLYWIVRILRERRAVTVPEALKEIYQQHFAALSEGEFLRFWGSAENRDMSPTAALTSQGQVPTELYWLAQGSVSLHKDGLLDRHLQAPCFVGEMSLMTNRPASASVTLDSAPAGVQVWSRATLDSLKQTQPVAWARVQSVLGLDLVRKIQHEESRYSVTQQAPAST